VKPYTISYADTPKSLNAGGTGSRRHWAVGYREKKRWEDIWTGLLLEAKVPKGMRKVAVKAALYFPTLHKRDAENYRSGLTKPLADAMVAGGWIPDDTAEFFNLVDFYIAADRGGPETVLALYPRYVKAAA
jgi:hypothetical protein